MLEEEVDELPEEAEPVPTRITLSTGAFLT